MKSFIKMLVLLASCMGLLWLGNYYTGSVVVSLASYAIEINLAIAISGLILLFMASHYVQRVVYSIMKIPANYKRNKYHNQREIAQQQLNLAFLSFFEYDYEKTLEYTANILKSEATSEDKFMAYVLDYKIALKLGDAEEIKKINAKMQETQLPNYLITSRFLYAEYLYNIGSYEECLILLSDLLELTSKHQFIYYLQMKANCKLSKFNDAYDLMKLFSKSSSINYPDLDLIQFAIIEGVFNNTQDTNQIDKIYQHLTEQQVNNPPYVRIYLTNLLRLNETNRIIKFIKTSPNHDAEIIDIVLYVVDKLMFDTLDSKQLESILNYLQQAGENNVIALLLSTKIKIQQCRFAEAKDDLIKAQNLDLNIIQVNLMLLKLAEEINDVPSPDMSSIKNICSKSENQ